MTYKMFIFAPFLYTHSTGVIEWDACDFCAIKTKNLFIEETCKSHKSV